MNIKIIALISLIFLCGSVFAYTYTVRDSQTLETILTCESNNKGGYLFFKPEYRPQPINGLKPIVNISLITGSKELRCE